MAVQERNLPTVVVVGNGLVGFRFLELLTRAAPERFRVVAFGEERVPAYDRVHLTQMLAGRELEDLLLAPRSWYRARGIELRTGDPVVGIDRDARTVTAQSGRRVAYDWLVLATGARPVVPPIPGVQCDGVFLYRSADDLAQIRARAESTARRVAVLGGGLLGLEAAHALRQLELHTLVVESAPHLMPRQLDEESAHALEERLEQLGVHCYVNTRVASIHAYDNQLVLSLDDGDALAADIAVIAAGVRPRDELARACGLMLGERGGIAVDTATQTSDARILAIGDCASFQNELYGLAAPGYAMARVAADRLVGVSTQFGGGDRSCRLDLPGVDVAVVGSRPAGAHMVASTGEGWRRTLALDGDRLVGAISIGYWPQLWRIDAEIARGARLTSRQLQRFRDTGQLWRASSNLPVAAWPREALVCNCAHVSHGDLADAINAGSRTIASLQRTTRAATVCGSCTHLVAELCGERSLRRVPRGNLSLTALSLAAVAACAVMVFLGPLLADRLPTDRISALWTEPQLRRYTGFTLLGTAALGLVLTLRKRLRWFRLGDYGWYRVFHACVGVACVALIGVHTGLRLGENFNRALSSVFLGVVVTGGIVGITAAAEAARPLWLARVARRSRPWVVWAHWLLLWVLPVFIGFHVLSVYYF